LGFWAFGSFCFFSGLSIFGAYVKGGLFILLLFKPPYHVGWGLNVEAP